MSSKAIEHAEVGPWKGRGLCFGAAFLWSTSGLFIKLLTQSPENGGAGWNGWQVAGFRALFAGITLLILGRPKRLLPTRPQFIIAMLTWPLLLTYVLAQTYTTTANAIFLQYTSPMWIFLLAPLLLKEKPKKADLLALPALVAGLLLIFVSALPETSLDLPRHRLGDLLALVSSFAYAGVVLSLRKWRDGSGPIGMAWGNLILAAIAIPAAFAHPSGFVTPDRISLPQVAFLGVFQIGAAYFLFQWSLRGVTAAEASILTLLEPVLCPIWAWLMIGDMPGNLGILGGAVVLLTLVLHTAATGKRAGAPHDNIQAPDTTGPDGGKADG